MEQKQKRKGEGEYCRGDERDAKLLSEFSRLQRAAKLRAEKKLRAAGAEGRQPSLRGIDLEDYRTHACPQ